MMMAEVKMMTRMTRDSFHANASGQKFSHPSSFYTKKRQNSA